ncbi:MAG: thioredoxin domain-containing protein [Rhizonema sp. PD37]|nr:thioredoxin domain-containing protein [Rhizonema sp. PD37]
MALLPISERDHIRGIVNAPVVLIKYGCYQCPYSSDAHKIITEILHQLNTDVTSVKANQLCFVFRHFFQRPTNSYAQKAAEAVEAAAAQGQFWQMHDTLFEHQHALEDSHIVQYANDIGLDIFQFLRDVSGRIYTNRVSEDIESGLRSGVTDSPALFINGIRYNNGWDRKKLFAAVLKDLYQ